MFLHLFMYLFSHGALPYCAVGQPGGAPTTCTCVENINTCIGNINTCNENIITCIANKNTCHENIKKNVLNI